MKKVLLLGVLALSTVCLTACGSKNFNMSFDEAFEIANHSVLQDILSQNDNFEQSFDIAGNYDADGNRIDVSISSESKQNVDSKKSESSAKFAANIVSSGETVKVDGTLDVKLVDEAVYINLSSFELTGSSELVVLGAMVDGFKDKWFFMPISGLNEMPETFSIFKDSKDLNSKVKEIVQNEGSVVYSGKFTQFNGYNAWKFSLDNEKLNALIKEYYGAMNSGLNEEDLVSIPEINIQNFEGYFVITGKDKVTTVIENMEMGDNDVVMVVNGFVGENFELYLSEEGEEIISIVAQKKFGKYEVSAKVMDLLSLNGTVSPKLSKSSIDLGFNANLTVKAQSGDGKDTVIPFKGSWKYDAISEFTVSVPEDAQDLTELLSSYLGSMLGGSDYMGIDGEYGDLEDVNDLEDEDMEVLQMEDVLAFGVVVE